MNSTSKRQATGEIILEKIVVMFTLKEMAKDGFSIKTTSGQTIVFTKEGYEIDGVSYTNERFLNDKKFKKGKRRR